MNIKKEDERKKEERQRDREREKSKGIWSTYVYDG